MPDISMCSNKSCPLCFKCYRFMAKPNPYRQSYGYFEPVDGKCDHYWPVDTCEVCGFSDERHEPECPER